MLLGIPELGMGGPVPTDRYGSFRNQKSIEFPRVGGLLPNDIYPVKFKNFIEKLGPRKFYIKISARSGGNSSVVISQDSPIKFLYSPVKVKMWKFGFPFVKKSTLRYLVNINILNNAALSRFLSFRRNLRTPFLTLSDKRS